MKPSAFEYHRAYSVGEVVDLLAELGDEAKILAGGQSLAPMMNFRLAHPTALVDVNRIPDLDYIRREADELRVGALCRHRAVEVSRDPEMLDGFGLLPRAARWIGHYPIRCRGTVGGSIAHSDSTAEWCLLATLFDAVIVVEGPDGRREVPASDWFEGFLTTAAEPGEMVVEVRFRHPRSHGALSEFARRQGDFAVAAVAVSCDVAEGRLANVGVALGGVAQVALRPEEAESLLEGAAVDDADLFREAGRAAAAGLDPPTDLNGDAAYRRHLVANLLPRAVREAVTEASS